MPYTLGILFLVLLVGLAALGVALGVAFAKLSEALFDLLKKIHGQPEEDGKPSRA